MLLLTFKTEEDRYAIHVNKIVEIIPTINLKKLAHAPKYIIGVFNYRGTTTPVLDLTQFTSNQASDDSLSTRIILIKFSDNKNNERLIGLKAQQVTETIKCDEKDFQSIGINTINTPYLGAISNDDEGMIQLVNVEQLLPASIRDELFGQLDEQIKTTEVG